MKLYIGVTDNQWFNNLRYHQPDEVNFWQPGGSSYFRALQPGELFLFKLHSPHDFIVGGGFFAHNSILPVSLAWQAFEQKNYRSFGVSPPLSTLICNDIDYKKYCRLG